MLPSDGSVTESVWYDDELMWSDLCGMTTYSPKRASSSSCCGMPGVGVTVTHDWRHGATSGTVTSQLISQHSVSPMIGNTINLNDGPMFKR